MVICCLFVNAVSNLENLFEIYGPFQPRSDSRQNWTPRFHDCLDNVEANPDQWSALKATNVFRSVHVRNIQTKQEGELHDWRAADDPFSPEANESGRKTYGTRIKGAHGTIIQQRCDRCENLGLEVSLPHIEMSGHLCFCFGSGMESTCGCLRKLLFLW